MEGQLNSVSHRLLGERVKNSPIPAGGLTGAEKKQFREIIQIRDIKWVSLLAFYNQLCLFYKLWTVFVFSPADLSAHLYGSVVLVRDPATDFPLVSTSKAAETTSVLVPSLG